MRSGELTHARVSHSPQMRHATAACMDFLIFPRSLLRFWAPCGVRAWHGQSQTSGPRSTSSSPSAMMTSARALLPGAGVMPWARIGWLQLEQCGGGVGYARMAIRGERLAMPDGRKGRGGVTGRNNTF